MLEITRRGPLFYVLQSLWSLVYSFLNENVLYALWSACHLRQFFPLKLHLSRNYCIIDLGKGIKGTVAWDGFFAHCILSRIEKKDLKFFSYCANIYWIRARFNSFSALGEYVQWNFSVRQANNFNCILCSYGSDIRCHLTWLKYWPFKVLISSWKISAHSPNTLKETKIRQKL